MPEVSHPTVEAQKRFWDEHWQHWRERKVINEWSLRRGQVILALLGSLRLDHPRILDLGCGIGWFTEKLAEFGEVTGIDLSTAAIMEAKSRHPRITFIAGNLYEIPLPAKHFDVVLSQEVIAHCEDQARYLWQAATALKPGGFLILTTPNKFVLDRLGDEGWHCYPPEHIEQFLNLKRLKRLLLPYFRVLRATTIIPMGHRGILRLINSPKVNRALEVLIPRQTLETLKERAGLGFSLVVLAQKGHEARVVVGEAYLRNSANG